MTRLLPRIIPLAACLSAISCQPPEKATSGLAESNSLPARIRELGSPDCRFVRNNLTPSEAVENAALRGEFKIFGRRVELVPPIDWNQDENDDLSFRFYLHTLDHLRVLFHMYAEDGNNDALRRAADMALDWIGSNPSGGAGVSEFAWYDMAVGIRAAYLAYLLRAGAHSGVLSDREVLELASSVSGHARYLIDGHNYAGRDNHGLFQDAGLFLLADYTPFFEESLRWKELASARFLGTLKRTVHMVEFMHLEHSPAYHFMVTELAGNLRKRAGIGDRRLDGLIAKLRDRAGWLVMPDGQPPCLGDTNQKTAPAWARNLGKRGLMLFPHTGYAIVRQAESYLILAAGFHSLTHKHQDELSFCLADSSRRIVVDSGHFSYNEGPARRYSLSPRAHNVLSVEGIDLPLRHLRPYGSGILAAGQGAGWFAVEGENPLLLPHGVRHRRLLLYRPGNVLLVIDRVESAEEREYVRYFHFDPGLVLEQTGSGARMSADSFQGLIRDWSGPGTGVRLVRGQKEPGMQGWVFLKAREPTESSVVELRNRAASGTLVAGIVLGKRPVEVVEALKDEYIARVRIDTGDARPLIRIVRRGTNLEVSVGH